MGIDIDSSVHEVYGELKQGAQFAYNHVYGLHPQYATIRSTGEVVAARLRSGSANSALEFSRVDRHRDLLGGSVFDLVGDG